MIAVADLVKTSRIPGNFFAPDAYVQGDIELGLLENREGARLMAIPEVLIEGIYAALEEEVGSAKSLVLFECGKWWGKTFYRRFNEEVSNYYETPLADMEMAEFVQCLKQCWKTHGWGTIDLDVNYYQQGFLVVKVWNAIFAQAAKPEKRPLCFTEAGLLSGFFSQLTGQDLHCVQTTCESLGAECNHFVLGLQDRVSVAEAWLEEGHDHNTIMERLCGTQPGKVSEPSEVAQVSEESLQLENLEQIVSPDQLDIPESDPPSAVMDEPEMLDSLFPPESESSEQLDDAKPLAQPMSSELPQEYNLENFDEPMSSDPANS